MVLPKNTATNSAVFPLSLVAGVLLALCISVGVRLDNGRPPGLPFKPYAHLLHKPAPFFELEGLEGGRVSSQKRTETWLLYFTESGNQACDDAYPTLKKVAQHLPVVVVGMGHRTQLSDKMAHHGIAATVGYDSLHAVPPLYQAEVFPSAMLIDPEGIVRQAAIGSNGIERIVMDFAVKEKGGL